MNYFKRFFLICEICEICGSNFLVAAEGRAGIVYALNSKENIICFIDEQRARKIAKSRQLKVSGTIGILMKMEEKGLILSAYEEVLRLKEKGFYVSNEIIENLKISSAVQ